MYSQYSNLDYWLISGFRFIRVIGGSTRKSRYDHE